MAAPLAFRRDAELGITALFMSPPGDCFTMSCPWNPKTPESGGYRSLYQSFFGRDLKAGETVRARCRMVINRGLTDDDILTKYRAFVN
jgi:hypothetical protein